MKRLRANPNMRWFDEIKFCKKNEKNVKNNITSKNVVAFSRNYSLKSGGQKVDHFLSESVKNGKNVNFGKVLKCRYNYA